MKNNNLVNEVNESEKMIDTVELYEAWLNSDESDDLANAYAEAYGDFIEEDSKDNGKTELEVAVSEVVGLLKESERMLKEAYIKLDIIIDKIA